jgi:hypothetical protein
MSPALVNWGLFYLDGDKDLVNLSLKTMTNAFNNFKVQAAPAKKIPIPLGAVQHGRNIDTKKFVNQIITLFH